MSQPASRATRRQSNRGDHHHPNPPDPMRPIYLGFAIVVAIIIVGFAAWRWHENARLASAYATPTPGPVASAKPISLIGVTTMGKATFPKGDTKTGGQGQPVDSMACATQEYVTLHVHQHLDLFAKGKHIQLPAMIGIVPTATGGCLYWMHTHDASGTIHVEAPQLAPAGGSGYTLGMFFDVWGMPLSRQGFATFKGPVTAYVNGALYTGALREIPMVAHQLITLEVGKPVVPPRNYTFPPGV